MDHQIKDDDDDDDDDESFSSYMSILREGTFPNENRTAQKPPFICKNSSDRFTGARLENLGAYRARQNAGEQFVYAMVQGCSRT